MVHRSVTAGLLTTSLVVAATGCASGTDKTSPAPSASAPASAGRLPPGLRAIDDLNHFVSMGVPNSWTVVDLSPSQIDRSLQKARITDPGIKAQTTNLQAAGAFYAVDSESAAHSKIHFQTHLNGLCQRTSLSSLALVRSATPDQFAKIGGRNIQVTDIKVQGGPALRWVYDLKVSTGTVKSTQVQVLAKGRVCNITFFTDQIDRYETVFNAMIPTIRLT